MKLKTIIYLHVSAFIFLCFFPSKLVCAETRTIDPIIIKSDNLRQFLNKQKEHIRLISFKNNKLTSIPFQIYSKDSSGNYLLEYNGNGEKNNVIKTSLTDNEEIVFIAGDAGKKIDLQKNLTNYKNIYEIEVKDETDKITKYAYLIYCEGNCPPESKIDYVNYNWKEDSIDSFSYSARFSKDAPISLDKLSIKETANGDNIDYLDKIKIRVNLTTFFNYRIEKNENDFKVELLGFTDGKIRVIRRVKKTMMLFWKIPILSANSESIFYGHSFSIPVVFNLPVPLDIFFKSGELRISSDGEIGGNRRFYNFKNSEGTLFDGNMSESEKILDYGEYDWQVVAGPQQNPGSWLNRVKIIPTPSEYPHLYYVDDITAPDPPENFKGRSGNVGYILKNFNKLKAGRYEITSYMYVLPDYKLGFEKQYLDILDNPLKTKINLISRH